MNTIQPQLATIDVPKPRHSDFRGRGFTLTELMVAVAITALLILAINQVFSTVSQGVRTGIGASEVIQNARMVGEQFNADFGSSAERNMVDPRTGGVLVIVNHKISGVHVLRTDDTNENGVVDSTENQDNVRDDQLMFISLRGTRQPLIGGNDNSYSNTTNATYMKVWYGHALRALPNGQTPDSNCGDTLGGPLTGSGTKQPANHFASEWVLARQAIFLAGGNSAPTGAYAAGAWFDSGISNQLTPPSGVPSTLYEAQADVAYYGLQGDPGAIPKYAGITGNKEDTSAISASHRLWRYQSDGTTSFSASQYASRAYTYLYDLAGVSPSTTLHRLMVNPTPAGYSTGQVAQVTPYLCGHVSDFVVEFAGDYNGDGKIDRDGSNGIMWYGLANLPPTGPGAFNAGGDSPYLDTVDANSDVRFVFRHTGLGASADSSNWPYLIRIRYRLLDSKGLIAGTDGRPGRWFEQIMTVNR